MTDTDRQRYLAGLVGDSISSYLAGDKTLAELSADLDSLIDGLREISNPEWVQELKSHWWEIEAVNAVNLAANRPQLTSSQDRRVREAAEELAAGLIVH